ncbi:protein adenylyltransferase SelO [Alginatibacterium sediminis]|uniref:protein adenylyltransferase SelO n=1 Tax=Alginatibacterium sediminis TaxID=2164068 RepID=UPI001F180C46|nr:YdiU family protein [Alginatibacterium sediminis]
MFINRLAQQMPEICFSQLSTPMQDPQWIIGSQKAAQLLDFNNPQMGLSWLSGHSIAVGMDPVSTVYSGHQFGGYTPQLGDGRALLLGEYLNESGQAWELQLKGSGLTPFSRQGDGKAVLRSSIREFLASEALAAQGIPTTRALGLVTGSGKVVREQLEFEAMVLRLAPSFLRFGHFEYLYHQQHHESLKRLIDFSLRHYFPQLLDSPNPVAAMLQEISRLTAVMIAHWQASGFCHGVMNSDNMSILGLTIDYGPFGFLESYDPTHICNHSDSYGRYAFDQQPAVGLWNLQRLGQALSAFVSPEEQQLCWQVYQAQINHSLQHLMALRLGLDEFNESDEILIRELLDILQEKKLDYHQSLRSLQNLDQASSSFGPVWMHKYLARISSSALTEVQRVAQICDNNPCYVLRNHLAQSCIEAAQQGDYEALITLHTALETPYLQNPEFLHLDKAAPDWAANIQVSCSS